MVTQDLTPEELEARLHKVEQELHRSEKLRRLKEHESREVHVEDDGESNWLISYADMMTLLFSFFVVLSAFSTPDVTKMEALKRETAESMGGKYVKPFGELSESIKKTLAEIDLEKDVNVTETAEGVTIVSKGTLFFDSGSARLKEQAALLMDKISGVLAEQAKGFRIVVEGHTDDVPIVSKEFPSNWELSSSRAGAVVRLLESKGFPGSDLRPVGLADKEPLVPNRDEAGAPIPANQAENRRIVIRVQKQLPKRLVKPIGNK
jgi:chemotaxis protein MotB